MTCLGFRWGGLIPTSGAQDSTGLLDLVVLGQLRAHRLLLYVVLS